MALNLPGQTGTRGSVLDSDMLSRLQDRLKGATAATTPTAPVPGAQPSQPDPRVGGQTPTLGNLGIQPTPVTRTAPAAPGVQPTPIQGPGVDAQGLPTMGTAGGVNSQLMAALQQMFRFNPRFQGVAPGSGELGPDFGQARELAMGGEFDPTFGEDYQRLFDRFTSQLDRGGAVPTVNLPDRLKLAQEALDRYNEAQAPVFQGQLRDVGARAAALGRTGAGMTTNELTDVVTREGDARRRFAQDVMADAIRGTAEDELARARLGLEGASLRQSGIMGLGGLDLQRQGLGQRAREFATGTLTDIGSRALDEAFRSRGEARGERDTRFNQDLAVRDALGDALSRGLDLSGTVYGQEAGIRGERRQLARDTINDRVQGAILEDQLAGNEFNRAMERARLLMGMSDIGGGEGNDLLSLYLS